MVVCQQCESETDYDSIAAHWSHPHTDCEHPPLTERQEELVVGSLMGDGSVVSQEGKNPRFKISNTNRKYLLFLEDQYNGFLGYVYDCNNDKEKSARRLSKINTNPVKSENIKDEFQIHSRNSPHLKKYRGWYCSGEKVWPLDIELTPRVLKHWYVQDGSLGEGRSLKIASANEIENLSKVVSYFERANLPDFNRIDGEKFVWNKQESKELFEYMGDPPPGFSRKWPEQYR